MSRKRNNPVAFAKSCRGMLLVLTLGMGCLISGCSKEKAEKEQTSLGVDRQVAGFLLNFDQRAETAALVRFQKSGTYPVRASWFFGASSSEDETELLQEAESSTDPVFLKDLYYALSNTIVLGNATDQLSKAPFYISLELPDGQECRFDYVDVNTIRLGEQNYVVESDGSLWTLIDRGE